MRISAVILECNPFHEGHRYVLQKARENADFVIAVMSGDFCERGIPAVFPKEVRTGDVLQEADAVLELPVFAATASSDFFAKGAVSLIRALSCVTDLTFGSESGDLAFLQECAAASLEETPALQQALQRHLCLGLSYPAALSLARKEVLGISSPKEPNDLLAVSYLRYLNGSGVTPHAVRRIPAESASSLRDGMRKDPASSPHPEITPVFSDDFSQVLLGKLLAERGLTSYADVSEDLARKIQKELPYYRDITGFVERLKSKDVTWTRLSRCLFHILLGIRKKDVTDYFSAGPRYARILGFRKESSPLISLLSKTSRIPMILRVTDGEKSLPGAALPAWRTDLFSSLLYDHVQAAKAGDTGTEINAYKKKVLILP